MLTKQFAYDKEIVFIVDNDSKKHGHAVNGITVCPPTELINRKGDYSRVVIAVENIAQVVYQLSSFGISEYTYFSDLYYDDFFYKSKLILDKNIQFHGQSAYTEEQVKRHIMNHLIPQYSSTEYLESTPTKGVILDVGSGCGTNLFQWLLNGYDAVGIDCCDWKLEFCYKKIEDFGFPKSWKNSFKFGYAENLPFENESFDLITCVQVLEHVKDWRKSLDEMLRCLKKGGSIFLKAPDYDGSYDDHYGIDIGVPISENVELLKKSILSKNSSLDVFEGLNFVSKKNVLDYLANRELRISDLDSKYPFVIKHNNKYLYCPQINLIIKKQ